VSTRVWFARDTGFTSDPKVQVLGDEYGPGAPLALEELMALAKLADNGGDVTVSYATLARRAFITPAKAKQIVTASASAGIINLPSANGKDFTASFPRWTRWQPKDPTAAGRKARQREAERAAQTHADVTP
jgi:hypothetical protein